MPQIAKQFVNIPMTNYSYELGIYNFLADTLFPVIPVKLRTGIYFKYSQDDLDVSGTDVRAPGSRAQVVDYDLSELTYGPLKDHSLKMKIPTENQENVMDPLDPIKDATRKLTRRSKLYKEVDAVTQLTSASITQTSTPTNLWNDYQSGGAGSDPTKDLSAVFDTLALNIQKDRKELTLVLSYPVYSALVFHPVIKEIFKYTKTPLVTPDMLAELFQVKEVLVGYAIKKTSADGVTPDVDNYVWGKHAWVMYHEDAPSLYSVSGAYTLNMPQIHGPWVMKQWYDNDVDSDYLRISYYYQQFIMAPQAIYWLNGVIA